MKRFSLFALALATVGSSCNEKAQAPNEAATQGATPQFQPVPPAPVPTTPLTPDETKQALYTLGVIIQKHTSTSRMDFSPAELAAVLVGVRDASLHKPIAVPMNVYSAKVDELIKGRDEVRNRREGTRGAAYLATKLKDPAFKKLATGMLVRVDQPGNGATPKKTDTVSVNYRGTLVDGTEFDSSYKRGTPTSFPLNRVIPCWTEGITQLKVGAKATFVCPPETAYREAGAGQIPGNSTITFEVELLDTKDAAGFPPANPAPPPNQ